MSQTLYMSTVAATIVTTAGKIVSASGAAITNKNTPIGTATGYGEACAKGTAAAWPASVTILNPSGNGWLYDVSTLFGQQLSGLWTPTVHLSTSAGNITADLHFRAFIYSSGSATYAQIGSDIVFAGKNITTVASDITFTGVTLPLAQFRTNRYLYLDLMPNITANNTGNGAAVLKVFSSNSSSQGNASAQLVLPANVAIPPAAGAGLFRREGNRGRIR